MLISNSWLTKGLHLILFIALCLIWGTTWLAIKISIESVAPIMSAGLRMLMAFPVFFVFVFVNGFVAQRFKEVYKRLEN